MKFYWNPLTQWKEKICNQKTRKKSENVKFNYNFVWLNAFWKFSKAKYIYSLSTQKRSSWVRAAECLQAFLFTEGLHISLSLLCKSLIWKKKQNLNPSCPVHLRNLHCIFISTLLCGASTGFIKAFKAFIKPFEAPQRSMKIKNLS